MDGMVKAAILTAIGGAGFAIMTDGTFDISMAEDMVRPYIHQMQSTVQYLSENGMAEANKFIAELTKEAK